jgi:hypothetical protein
MWSYRLVDETGSRLELVIDLQGIDRPKLVDVGVRLQRKPSTWACTKLVEHDAYDWRPSTPVLFSDDAGKALDVSASVHRAPLLDSEMKRIAELLRHFREHVAGLAAGTSEHKQVAMLAALDSRQFAARTRRGAAKVNMSSEHIAINTAAQARYRDRLKAGLIPLPPVTDEEREELEWPAKVWRRRRNNDS